MGARILVIDEVLSSFSLNMVLRIDPTSLNSEMMVLRFMKGEIRMRKSIER